MGCEDRLRGLEEHQGLLRRLQPQRRTVPDVSGNPAPRGRARALWLLVSCWDAAQLLIHPLPRRVRSAPRRLFQSRARCTTMSGLLSFFARGAEAPSITDQAEIDRLSRRHSFRVMVAITLGYGLIYTCRLALGVVKKPLIDQGIFPPVALGSNGSALFYTYSLGKLTNGFLADHANVRRFLTVSFPATALSNLSMGFATTNGKTTMK